MYTYEKECRGLWGIKRERIGLRWKVLGRLIIFWCNCSCNWMHKLGNLHPSALEIAPGLGPRAISLASRCKLPQGAYFPIHPSSRQCIITIHLKSHLSLPWLETSHLWYRLQLFFRLMLKLNKLLLHIIWNIHDLPSQFKWSLIIENPWIWIITRA